jgi:curli biogenesis system outer membrane secretion channel CsgG
MMMVGLVAGLAAGCGPTAGRAPAVRPTGETADATRVGLVRMPYDPSLPFYVVTVEPFTFEADGSGPPPAGAAEQMGNAIAIQLVTALGNAGNIRILDYEYYWQRRERPATLVRRNAGEVGPFVIRGAVTEFQEVADAPEPGGTRRTGSVLVKLHIVDPANGRIVGSVDADGRVTTDSAGDGFSLFGFGRPKPAFAASALGQANRVAVNSAARQVCERLSRLR